MIALAVLAVHVQVIVPSDLDRYVLPAFATEAAR